MPDRLGVYEVRSFAVDKLRGPQPLSAIIGKTVTIEIVGTDGYETSVRALTNQ